jgi:ABC-type transporter lipoprotein component MlaA
MQKKVVFKYVLNFSLFAVISLSSVSLNAQKNRNSFKTKSEIKATFENVPWDTVTAKIQILRSTAMPDSVVLTNIQQVLDSYSITKELYQKFYQSIQRQTVEQQSEFLERVQKIIQSLLQQEPLKF